MDAFPTSTAPTCMLAAFAVAARVARIVAALEAQPTTTKLGAPTTEWLAALAPAVKLAPLRLLLQNADNWVRQAGRLGRSGSPL